MTSDQLKEVTYSYLVCLLWVMPGDDDNENPGDSLSIHCDLGEGVREKAEADCKNFASACGLLFDLALQQDGYTLAQWGHDFALSRNGHGTGFWDRKELKPMKIGERISKLCGFCTLFPENNLYIGDDGKAYFERMT